MLNSLAKRVTGQLARAEAALLAALERRRRAREQRELPQELLQAIQLTELRAMLERAGSGQLVLVPNGLPWKLADKLVQELRAERQVRPGVMVLQQDQPLSSPTRF
jgi:hypothetical protein